MAVRKSAPPFTPVHFFSHGSTMMLGEESGSADYWKKCGDEAIANDIKHIIMMGAHWACLHDQIQVATHPNPAKDPVAYVHPSKYIDYKLNPDLPMAERCIKMLSAEGFNVTANDKFDWIHDTYLILIRIFPDGCPPTTIVSMNAHYDPHYHMKIGSCLRSLRDPKENTLFIGTGGAVHNLYRNKWKTMVLHHDNFGMAMAPEAWALDFRQEFQDAILSGGGPGLRRNMTILMKLPQYRDAHATDDHFMAAMFVAGLVGDWEDEGTKGELGAEDWELTNMCNSQFTLGAWPERDLGES